MKDQYLRLADVYRAIQDMGRDQLLDWIEEKRQQTADYPHNEVAGEMASPPAGMDFPYRRRSAAEQACVDIFNDYDPHEIVSHARSTVNAWEIGQAIAISASAKLPKGHLPTWRELRQFAGGVVGETPRTNAVVDLSSMLDDEEERRINYGKLADLCAQLERELNEVRAEKECLRDAHVECVVAMVPFIPAFGYLKDAIKELGNRATALAERGTT